MSADDLQDVEERRRAARALLLHPLLTAEGKHGDDFRLVRRHQSELTKMFAGDLRYRLHVAPTVARLFKPGVGRDSTRPLYRRSGATFSPRTYALLCLTIAALTRCRSQLLVDELVQQVRSAAVDAGIEVDLDAISDRRALHAALWQLIGLGVLRERDGDLEHWADQRTQSLLDVRRDLLALLVSAPMGAMRSADDVLAPSSLPSAIGGARVAIRRQLLESPSLTSADLSDEHAEWWRRNRNRERDWYDTRFGLSLELRTEGAAVIDPDGAFTDEHFPGADKTRQLALLVLERLVDTVLSAHGEPSTSADGDVRGWRPLLSTEAERAAHRVRDQWHSRLRRDQQDDPGEAISAAFDVLRRFGLIRRQGDLVLVHPAAARYSPQVAIAEASATGERSLFDITTDDED